MRETMTSIARRCLRGVTSVPMIIKRYPLPFIVLCFKALLSVTATLSQDFMIITRYATVSSGYLFGSYTAWVLLLRLSYYSWLVLPVNHPYLANFPDELFSNPTPSISLLFLFLKLPIIVADVLSGLLVYKIVFVRSSSHQAAYNTFRAWFYNPVITLVAEMFGSIDIVAAMLVLACIYYFMRNRLVLSSTLLLISIAFRTYPLLILPILLIMVYKREEKRGKNLGILIAFTVLPLVAPIIFLTVATNGAFLGSITVVQTDYWFFLGPLLYPLYMALEQPIAVTVALFVLVLFVVNDHEKQGTRYREDIGEGNNAVSYVFMLLLALFAFSYWNPQFLLWILPFATLDYGLKKSSMKLLFSFTLTAALWAIIYFGFYFSTLGTSVFFIPNSNPIMIQFSQWLNWLSSSARSLSGTEIIREINLLTVLKSMFTGVCLLYLVMKCKELALPAMNRSKRVEISKGGERSPRLSTE